jgi:hypothetical protein
MYATMQYELMQARVAELHRQAENDRLIQAAGGAHRARTEPRPRSRHPVTALGRRVLSLRGALAAPAR